MRLASGAGVVDRTLEPSESLARAVAQIQRRVDEQKSVVAKASDAFHDSLSSAAPETQLALKSRFDVEILRLTHLEQELRVKRDQWGFAEAQRLKFIEQQKAESEFKAATERLNKSRTAITHLQELQRDLPTRLGEAQREFHRALENYNQRKAAANAQKWQHSHVGLYVTLEPAVEACAHGTGHQNGGWQNGFRVSCNISENF